MKIHSFEGICDILQSEISQRSGIDVKKIDIGKSLEEYGLDSMNVVRLAATLEESLKIDVEPTLMYEYSSLQKMAQQFEILHKKSNSVIDRAKPKMNIHIAASFTAEPIEEMLTYWLEKLSYKPVFSFAGYNQVFQELLDVNSELFANNDINIMLVRVEDWFRFSGRITHEKLTSTLNEFLACLANAAQRQDFELILGVCSHSPTHIRKLGISEIIEDLDQKILNVSQQYKNIHTLDLRKLNNEYKVGRIYDEARDHLGHIPFTQTYFAAIATALSKQIFLLQHPPYKVIVLDCDNTLWSGVCGEDGYDGVEITSPFYALQKFMVQQMQCGKILCVASKNRDQDVWDVFEKNAAMLLKKEHIVASRINWQPKSQNIKEMAEELQLGLDSFIFIDDNPAECAEVKNAVPQVCVLHIPKNPQEMMATVQHFWPLDSRTTATEEDKNRTKMYAQNKQRKELESGISNFEDFLQQLQIKIHIEKLSDDNISRAAQLTQRSNQFNATTIRRSESDIKNLINFPNFAVFSVHVKDKFGDYGFVGLMISELQKECVVCETFLMSCRVLGRKVETTMLQTLAEFAKEEGATRLILNFQPSERNEPLFIFYSSLDNSLSQEGEMQQVVLEVDNIKSVVENATLQKSANNKPKQQQVANITNICDALQEIANVQGDMNKALASVTSVTKLKRPSITTAFVTSRTSWQKKLAAIWCEVLRMEKVGIYDNFYELGGDSLRAAEVFAKMWDLGVPDSISLQTIPNPTVAGLAQAIDDVKNGKKPQLLMDTFSLEDEAKVANDIVGQPHVSENLTMQNIFLTGATGYIGAFLISELFLQSSVEITCLVRAATKEDGIERVRKNLQGYNLWKDEYQNRLSVVLGDLTEPLFGLCESKFAELSGQIDTIFHSGAWVNFVYPYQYLQKANVYSVETVLRLAASSQTHPIQVHFISTLGVIMSTGYPRGELVYESQELKHSEDLLNGYEQSKFVGDKMVWLAMKERNIPASMYRPGMVSGLSSDGTYHKLDEFLPCFLKGCIQMGSWPLLDTTWEIVPIDYLAKAIVHIALRPENLGKAYFSLHPNPRPVCDFIKWHQDFGFNIRGLPWEVWKKELLGQKGEKLRQNALFPFIDFIRALSEKQVYFPPTDKSQFLEGISDSKLECPDQLTLIERYTNYFIKIGYYKNSNLKSELGI